MLAKTYIVVGAIAFAGLGLTRVRKPFDASVRDALAKSLPLLVSSGHRFIERSHDHCVSCHHTALTSMAEGLCRQKGVPVSDTGLAYKIAAIEHTLAASNDLNHVKDFVETKIMAPYLLLALSAEKQPADVETDKTVDFLVGQQENDGSFHAEFGRPPLGVGDAHLTALAVRAVQLYAGPSKQAEAQAVTAKALSWLRALKTGDQQELAFQLLGLHWCGFSDLRGVADRLLALQRPDGGWAQLPTLSSDAYATGQALYALAESGVLRADAPVYRRGVAWLLAHQDKTGAWIVLTRTYPIQPFFTSDFPPYDENQFISATATNWATLALLEALPDKGA